MCGIIGYIGKRDAAPLLLDALRRLEYRGYDSVGEATIYQDKLYVKKDRGKIEDVHRKLKLDDLPGNVGIGHCLHPNTLIQLADGKVSSISELGQECHVMAYDLERRKFVKAGASCFKHPSPPYLCKIKTSSTEIICTENHRLLVAESNGKIVERKGGEIKQGDLLLCAEKISVSGKPRALKDIKAKRYFVLTAEGATTLRRGIRSAGVSNVAKRCGISKAALDHLMANDRKVREDWLNRLTKDLDLELPPASLVPSSSTHGKWVIFPRETNEKLMQIIGYTFGDGYIGKRSVRFKDMDRHLLEKYNKLFEELFGVTGRIVKMKQTKAYLLEINSKYLCEWLKENFPGLSQGECPSWLGELPESQIFAFIGGFFDAEGTVGQKSRQLLIRTVQEKTTRIIQILLLRAGILASYSKLERFGNPNWNVLHSLTISNHDHVKLFVEKVPLLSNAKLAKIMKILPSLREGLSYTHFKVPVPKEKIRKSFKHPSLKGQGYATTCSIHKILGNGGLNEVSKFLEAPIAFQRVISNEKIKSDTEYLYDLEVPGFENFFANCIVSHNSRWATHGVPSRENAHPHLDETHTIAVVHNGIIENYAELRKFLMKQGYKFKSETDTEVVPHLINYFIKKGEKFEEAVRLATERLEGSYALAIAFAEEPDKIIAVRKESPLILGLGKDETLLASDIPAVLPHTKRVIILEDGEMAILSPGKAIVKRLDSGKLVRKTPMEVAWTMEMAEKRGYPHFMLKEIHEQPDAIRETLRASAEELDKLSRMLLEAKRVYLVACGTAYHAALVGKYALAQLADVSAEVVISSEFQESCMVDDGTVLLAISQSGETADTLKAVKVAKAKGARIACLTNVVGSSITRESEVVCHTYAGPEIGVAATKTFSAQVAYLLQLALHLTKKRRRISGAEFDKLIAQLREIPEIAQKMLKEIEPLIKSMAKRYKDAPNFYFIGRGIGYPIVMEGALKLKEIAYIHSEATPAGELKHGPLALIEQGVPVVAAVVPSASRSRMMGNVEETKARGGTIIALAAEDDLDIEKHASELIRIPKTHELFTPLTYIIPLQLLAYYISAERGFDPDKPRHLAKSVTVE